MRLRGQGAFVSVHIYAKQPVRKRGNRAIGLDNAISKFADQILDLQAKKHVNSRELAAELNRLEIPSPSGRKWSDARVFRMLRRGVELGIPFKRRDRSDAATRRKVHRRSKEVIDAEKRAGFQLILGMLKASAAPNEAPTTALVLLRKAKTDD